MNPTFRQLEAFVLAYRHGNLTVAGRQMGLTQSAVSVLLRELEDRTGARLFDRTTRRVTPTEAARQVLPLAQRALDDVASFGSTLRGLSELAHGRVRFAATAAVAALLLPPVLAAFQQRHPEIEIVLLDLPPERLAPALLAGDAEFALGTIGSDDPLLAHEILASGPLCAICRQPGALDGRDELSWAALADLPIIAVAEGGGLRDLVRQTMTAQGLACEPRFEVSLLSTALALVGEGAGLSVLPRYLAGRMPAGFRAVPLSGPAVTRELRLLRRTDRVLSAAASALLQALRDRPGADDETLQLAAE